MRYSTMHTQFYVNTLPLSVEPHIKGQGPISRSLRNLLLKLRDFEAITVVSNTICLGSKTSLMYQNATN